MSRIPTLWLWWAPLGVFILFWAVVGFRYGWVAVNTSETDVINRYADAYLKRVGAAGALTDCHATPAPELPGVWLVVRCQPRGTLGSYDYFVNRLGGLVFFRAPVPLGPGEVLA